MVRRTTAASKRRRLVRSNPAREKKTVAAGDRPSRDEITKRHRTRKATRAHSILPLLAVESSSEAFEAGQFQAHLEGQHSRLDGRASDPEGFACTAEPVFDTEDHRITSAMIIGDYPQHVLPALKECGVDIISSYRNVLTTDVCEALAEQQPGILLLVLPRLAQELTNDPHDVEASATVRHNLRIFSPRRLPRAGT